MMNEILPPPGFLTWGEADAYTLAVSGPLVRRCVGCQHDFPVGDSDGWSDIDVVAVGVGYCPACSAMSGPPEHADRSGHVTYPCPGCGAPVVHGGQVHVCGRIITGAPVVGAKPVGELRSCTVCGARGKTTVGKEWRCWKHGR